MRYDWNILLGQLEKNKKQRDMQSMIDQARKQGADIDMEYDLESGQFIPHIKYKRQSKSEQLEDMIKTQKLIMEASKEQREKQKEQREETQAKQGEEFNWLAELGFGGGAQRLARQGVSGQIKPVIKRALEMRNKFRGAGQTLLPTEKGWTRTTVKNTKQPIVNEKGEIIGYRPKGAVFQPKGASKELTLSTALSIISDPFKAMQLKRTYPELYKRAEQVVIDSLGEDVITKIKAPENQDKNIGNIGNVNW